MNRKGKRGKRKIVAKIGGIKKMQVNTVKNDSLLSQIMKEDEEKFNQNPTLSAFVRDIVPGEIPENFWNSEEEKKNAKYMLVKIARNVIGMRTMGKYPISQEEFEMYQADTSLIDNLDVIEDSTGFYKREE